MASPTAPKVNAPSVKHAIIDKETARMMVYISVAMFLTVFSLVSVKTLISRASTQNKIISQQRVVVKQLQANNSAAAQLKQAYDAFNSTPQNIIGGSTNGNSVNSGSNTKIVMDALPSSYDFPGLAAEVDNIISTQQYNHSLTIQSISGTDDETTQGGNTISATPQAVAIPFSLTINGSYTDTQTAISALNKSIRPIQIQTLTLAGTEDSLMANITAQTFYQPAKSLHITTGGGQ